MADNSENFKLNKQPTESFIEQLKKPQYIDTDSIINPPKKKYAKGMCVVCLKTLDNEKEIADMMCGKCETKTSEIANKFTQADNERYELGKEAISLMVELLPSKEYGENFDCERLQNIICELSGYDFK